MYEPNGDDVDSFSQKVKFCLENIFECLQHLKRNGAQAGLDGDASPYEIRINTADGCIYIRDGDNTKWFLLGEVADYFGITPEKISAVRNGGGMGRLIMGTEDTMPLDGNSTFDLFFAQETSRVFIWTGTTWRKFLSLNFGDILNYEKYCIARHEVDYSGADKILRLDKEPGKANVYITGSANKIDGVNIEAQDVNDGEILQYNVIRNSFVPVKKDEFDDSSATTTSEANKFVKVGEDGQILRYHEATNTFRNEDQTSAVGIGKSLILRDGEKVLGDYNGAQTVTVNLQDVLNRSTLSHEVAHLMRLTENLYLAPDVAGLNPGGHDGLSGDTFYGEPSDIDATAVDVQFLEGRTKLLRTDGEVS